jgi:hypothetical protein
LPLLARTVCRRLPCAFNRYASKGSRMLAASLDGELAGKVSAPTAPAPPSASSLAAAQTPAGSLHDGSASLLPNSGTPTPPSAAAQAAAQVNAATQRHKDITKRICEAASAGQVLELVASDGQGLQHFNLLNAVTAFHRLAKVGACSWLPGHL